MHTRRHTHTDACTHMHTYTGLFLQSMNYSVDHTISCNAFVLINVKAPSVIKHSLLPSEIKVTLIQYIPIDSLNYINIFSVLAKITKSVLSWLYPLKACHLGGINYFKDASPRQSKSTQTCAICRALLKISLKLRGLSSCLNITITRNRWFTGSYWCSIHKITYIMVGHTYTHI